MKHDRRVTKEALGARELIFHRFHHFHKWRLVVKQESRSGLQPLNREQLHSSPGITLLFVRIGSDCN